MGIEEADFRGTTYCFSPLCSPKGYRDDLSEQGHRASEELRADGKPCHCEKLLPAFEEAAPSIWNVLSSFSLLVSSAGLPSSRTLSDSQVNVTIQWDYSSRRSPHVFTPGSVY